MVVVNIYGSFACSRYKKLEALRDHLRNLGYYARLSTDLEETYPKNDDESDDEYNLRISEKFIESGNIHLLFFFKAENIHRIFKILKCLKNTEIENVKKIIDEINLEDLVEKAKKEINLNVSPAMEFKTICDLYSDWCITVFYEENSIEELKTLLKGLIIRLGKNKKIYVSRFILRSDKDFRILCGKCINAVEDCIRSNPTL